MWWCSDEGRSEDESGRALNKERDETEMQKTNIEKTVAVAVKL